MWSGVSSTRISVVGLGVCFITAANGHENSGFAVLASSGHHGVQEKYTFFVSALAPRLLCARVGPLCSGPTSLMKLTNGL